MPHPRINAVPYQARSGARFGKGGTIPAQHRHAGQSEKSAQNPEQSARYARPRSSPVAREEDGQPQHRRHQYRLRQYPRAAPLKKPRPHAAYLPIPQDKRTLNPLSFPPQLEDCGKIYLWSSTHFVARVTPPSRRRRENTGSHPINALICRFPRSTRMDSQKKSEKSAPSADCRFRVIHSGSY